MFAFLGSKITFEEDITSLLPSTKDGGAKSVVFSNLKVKDKIFIIFTAKTDSVSADQLVDACDEFIGSLLEKDSVANRISNVLYQIDENLISSAIQFLYENIPIFLDTSQYKLIEQLLDEESIDKQMADNYATLISPAGMAFKDMIVQDPISLRNIFLSDAGNIGNGLGGSYKFYNNHIFTSDSSAVIAFLSPDFKSFDSKQGVKLIEMIEAEINEFLQNNSDIEILFHGAPINSVFNSRQIKIDLLLTISISILLIFIILVVCFRNASTLIYLVLPVIYGVLFALAVMYLVKGSMSLMALGIGAIVMGVAFSYCMHIITHFKYVNDPVIVLKDQTVPVILGALTTIGAFMGLMLTNSELLRDFGLFASLGLVGTTVFNLLFLPQFFNTKKNKKADKAFAFLEKINSFPFEKQKWLIGVIVAISVVCFFASKYVKFDSNLQNIGYHDEKIVRSQKFLASKTNNNFTTIYFAAASDNLDSALIYSKVLSEKLNELVINGDIGGYSTPSSLLFIPAEEQKIRINYWNKYWTEEKKDNIRKEIVKAGEKHKFNANTFNPFFNMLDMEYEPVSLYDSEIIPHEILDNIIEYTDGRYLVFIPVQMTKEDLLDVGSKIINDNSTFVVIDPMYYTNDMVKIIHDDFDIALTISSLFVLLVLLISYKNIILALLAFIPMGLSWYIVLGIMAIFGIEFNLINIVISTFIFGIGVDYSIFIMDGLLSAYRKNSTLLVYHKTAIFFSAVILIIVITSLLFAIHPAISSIGVSTLIGMGATILIAYSLQPYLFTLLITNRIKKGKAPISINNLFSFFKKQNPEQELKNNYLYKGNNIEKALRKELHKSGNYKVISETISYGDSLLDIGCGYGFTSYFAAILNDKMNITGYNIDIDEISIADNCYKKTNKVNFTTSLFDTNEEYDIIIINENILEDITTVEKLFLKAKIVILKVELINIYHMTLKEKCFYEKISFGNYYAYAKQINMI